MRDSKHVVSRLDPKERNFVVQSSSRIKEGFVKWVAQVLVERKVLRLACRSLVGTNEVEAYNSAEMTDEYAGYTRGP